MIHFDPSTHRVEEANEVYCKLNCFKKGFSKDSQVTCAMHSGSAQQPGNHQGFGNLSPTAHSCDGSLMLISYHFRLRFFGSSCRVTTGSDSELSSCSNEMALRIKFSAYTSADPVLDRIQPQRHLRLLHL